MALVLLPFLRYFHEMQQQKQQLQQQQHLCEFHFHFILISFQFHFNLVLFEGVCLVLRASSGKHARLVGVCPAAGDSAPGTSGASGGVFPECWNYIGESVFQPPEISL